MQVGFNGIKQIVVAFGNTIGFFSYSIVQMTTTKNSPTTTTNRNKQISMSTTNPFYVYDSFQEAISHVDAFVSILLKFYLFQEFSKEKFSFKNI